MQSNQQEDFMEPNEFKIGDQVIWGHQPHGGYGVLIDVPAVVVGKTAKRVRIAAQRTNLPPKLVTVRPSNLKRLA